MKIYREIVRNTEMGIQSIQNLMSHIEDEDFRRIVTEQQDGLRNFYNRALNQLDCDEQEQAKSGFFEKNNKKSEKHRFSLLYSLRDSNPGPID